MLLMQSKVYCLYTSKSEPVISRWTHMCLTTDSYTYITFDDGMSIDKETEIFSKTAVPPKICVNSHTNQSSVSQPPGRGPVPGPGINYTGPREARGNYNMLQDITSPVDN